MTWAWSQRDPSPGALLVLVALADHAGDHAGEDWTCFPSVERLMDFTNQSRATVERHLAWLDTEGFISRTRRKLAGGRLGVYDYVLHRVRRVDPAPSAEVDSGRDHTSNCSMDHASNCGSTMRQNEGSHASNCGISITPIEPSVEPSERERASDDDVERVAAEVLAAWGEHQHRSSRREVAKALHREVKAGADLARIKAACVYYAARRSMWGVSSVPLAPHKFVAEGRWETIAGVIDRGDGSAGARTAFACAKVRAAVVAEKGDAFATSWLDPCGWVEATKTITPGLRTRGDKLRSEVGDVLKILGVRVEGQG